MPGVYTDPVGGWVAVAPGSIDTANHTTHSLEPLVYIGKSLA